MLISKSNVITTNTLSLVGGTLSSGVLANLKDSNFAKNITTSSNTLTFLINSVGSANYFALHGLSLPIGSVVSVSATGFTKSFTTTRDSKNLFFYNNTATTFGTTTISITSVGIKTICYISAGLYSYIAWGVDAGQSLYYLGTTSKSRASVTSRGMPTNRVQEESAPKLSIKIKNALKTWARGDLQDILEHYKTTGILSIIDYETDNLPDESVAGFDLGVSAPTAHNQTLKLVDVTLSLRISA
jgi:hypothetical protein